MTRIIHENPVLRGSIDATYTADFFRQHDSAFSPHIAEANLSICDDQVRSMLDVGCGLGFLVEAMRLRGVDAYGLEGSSAAESLWPEHSRHKYLVGDLTRLDDFEQVAKCDLVTSFEVAEHLYKQFAGHFVQTLTPQAWLYRVRGGYGLSGPGEKSDPCQRTPIFVLDRANAEM